MFSACDDGEEFGPDGHCVRCSKGSYKAAGEMSASVSCPLGFSTPSDGAKDVSECTLLYCPPGKYATASVCQPCGIGFYQNLYNSSYRLLVSLRIWKAIYNHMSSIWCLLRSFLLFLILDEHCLTVDFGLKCCFGSSFG
ncbi:unnamed protein product [Soboliphyme baturini]|uniref:Ephrin_rec_like domain-containing protein n=1 Tax=Soboliphyme baturini TaxID=241478 RepID=A0A183J775_9BILA|nr:unnamed protein product [Soboliphyme baturini]